MVMLPPGVSLYSFTTHVWQLICRKSIMICRELCFLRFLICLFFRGQQHFPIIFSQNLDTRPPGVILLWIYMSQIVKITPEMEYFHPQICNISTPKYAKMSYYTRHWADFLKSLKFS